MSLYNMVHGIQPTAKIVVIVLGLEPPKIDRLRDAFIVEEKGEVRLVVRTRTGGPNRADHSASNDALKAHPAYIEDRDEPFDPTFAVFHFRPPADLVDDLRKAMTAQHPKVADLEAFTNAGIEEMTKNGPNEATSRFMGDLAEKIGLAPPPKPSGDRRH